MYKYVAVSMMSGACYVSWFGRKKTKLVKLLCYCLCAVYNDNIKKLHKKKAERFIFYRFRMRVYAKSGLFTRSPSVVGIKTCNFVSYGSVINNI